MLELCDRAKINWDNTAPRKPNQKAFVESFNARMREELLNETWFTSLNYGRETLRGLGIITTRRPYSLLGYAILTAFAVALKKQEAAALQIAGRFATERLASPARKGNNNAKALIKTG